MSKISLVDSTEAPNGFYAVQKPEYSTAKGNICNGCEWRKQCNDEKTDLTLHNHRCMASTVTSRLTGEEIKRKDGQSVIFKKL